MKSQLIINHEENGEDAMTSCYAKKGISMIEAQHNIRILLILICILLMPIVAIAKDTSESKNKAYLGIDVANLTPDAVQRLGLSSAEGLLITTLIEGSPAFKQGLQLDDVLTAIDSTALSSTTEFIKIIANYHSGDKAKITFIRLGTSQSLNLLFGSRPKPPKAKNLTYNKTKAERIKGILDHINEHNKSMGCLAIGKGKMILFNQALGYRYYQSDKTIPSDINTRYRIGSISKTFTSVMIYQLVEEHKLKLETKLSAFFPTIPNAKDISILMLLTHQSGIFSFTDMPDYLNWSTEKRSHAEIIERILEYEPDFKPGEKYTYSNSNYLLLGYIIEMLDNCDYSVSLQNRITDRIGLQNTYYGGKINTTNNEALSYNYMGYWDQWLETDMSVPGGAGAIVSTASDLVIFMGALFDGKLLSKKSLKQMLKVNDGVGSGIFEMPIGNNTYYAHTGAIDNFRSILLYSPKDKHAIAYLSNGEADIKLSVIVLVSGVLADQFVQIPNYKKAIQITNIDKFIGHYSNQEIPMKMSISAMDGDLYAQADGQPKIHLDVIDSFRYECSNIDLVIDFSADGNSFTLKQGGESLIFVTED
ncbi:MAG: serine hydrolase [Candidatus Cloacimonas sp.]|jgi:CubicO group peptidase (beta-lactamase class C family)|nr:serine hydrolase [Candidatus Cloacimonas sp.]